MLSLSNTTWLVIISFEVLCFVLDDNITVLIVVDCKELRDRKHDVTMETNAPSMNTAELRRIASA